MARLVRADLAQHDARLVVDDDVGIGRMIIGPVDGAGARMHALALRLCLVRASRGNRQRCHDAHERKRAPARDPSPHFAAPRSPDRSRIVPAEETANSPPWLNRNATVAGEVATIGRCLGVTSAAPRTRSAPPPLAEEGWGGG